MRVLKFDGSKQAQEVFQTIHDGWLMSTTGLKGLEQLRSAIRVLDALEAVSEPVIVASGDGVDAFGALSLTRRKLKAEGGPVYLEEAEFAMLKGALGSLDWRPFAARRALAALEALEHVQQQSPATAKRE